MVRPIVRDTFFLAQKSLPATREDLPTVTDLMDTLRANADRCVGMAANMIGRNRRIIAFADGSGYTAMLNPQIIESADPYETEEGCLSLDGTRPATRYKRIRVRYQNAKLEPKTRTLKDFPAQIVQHECDHLDGILI